MFELYQRDGYSKQKIADSDDLSEIAQITLEMSGTDLSELAEEVSADG